LSDVLASIESLTPRRVQHVDRRAHSQIEVSISGSAVAE
jgi:hypothetical protein